MLTGKNTFSSITVAKARKAKYISRQVNPTFQSNLKTIHLLTITTMTIFNNTFLKFLSILSKDYMVLFSSEVIVKMSRFKILTDEFNNHLIIPKQTTFPSVYSFSVCWEKSLLVWQFTHLIGACDIIENVEEKQDFTLVTF